MKRIINLLRGWIDGTQNLLVLWFLFILFLLIIRVPLTNRFPESLLVTIVNSITVLSIFLCAVIWGVVIIKNKEAPIFIVPLKGTGAIIFGTILALGGLVIFLWYLVSLLLRLLA